MRFRVLIDGMLSVHAKHAVFTALSGAEGVRSAEVEIGEAVVECESGTRAEGVRAAIEAAGYGVRSITRELPTM